MTETRTLAVAAFGLAVLALGVFLLFRPAKSSFDACFEKCLSVMANYANDAAPEARDAACVQRCAR